MAATKTLANYLPRPQAAMLDLLSQAATGPVTFTAMQRVAGLTRTLAMNHLNVLRERELVDQVRHGSCRGPALYAINADGRAVLASHYRAATAQVATPAPSMTYSTAGTVYRPAAGSYYRNAGNRHIDSHGVPC